MSKKSQYTVKDRLEQISESIDLIVSRCENVYSANDFLLSPDNVMKFDSCVMRFKRLVNRLVKF